MKTFFILLILIFTVGLLQANDQHDAKQPPLKPVDNTQYALVLKKYVNAQGMVNYAELTKHKTPLTQYLTKLGQVDSHQLKKMSNATQIVFWINAYNAITLKSIVDHYPIKSIKEIKGVWKKQKHLVASQLLTLNQIEHEILRKQFNEPRIHVALVCAAKSCPPLLNEPYVAKKLSQQFDERARIFLAHPENFKINRQTKVVYLSAIFQWFGSDFTKKHLPKAGFGTKPDAVQASLNFIFRYINQADASYLRDESYSIQYLNYDWALNELKPKS